MRKIRYGEISREIKDLVREYYNQEIKNNPDLTLETAMSRWFDNQFDDWIDKRLDGVIISDEVRRKSERRTEPVKTESLCGPDKRESERRGQSRREEHRFRIEIPVKIIETMNTASLKTEKLVEIAGTTENISSGGFHFKSDVPLGISSMIKVMIELSKIDSSLDDVEATALIVGLDEKTDEGFGYNVMFSRVSRDQKENLDVMLFAKLALQQSQLYLLF